MGLFDIFKDQSSEPKSRFDNDVVMPKFEVPEGIKVIDYKTLPDYEIEEIILPSTLISVDNSDDCVFESRRLLKRVDFSKVTMLREIPESCFDGCVALESITVPEGVVKVGDCAFDGCNNLVKVILPSSLEDVSTLNSLKKCDVYLFSNKIDESSFDEMADSVNNIYVTPQALGRYQEMKEELGLEVNLNVIPNEFLSQNVCPPPPAVNAEELSFMVGVNGESAGPYTISELRHFVSTGEFTPQVYVWRKGMPQWVLAANVPELANLF